jgi:hypothetical protein
VNEEGRTLIPIHTLRLCPDCRVQRKIPGTAKFSQIDRNGKKGVTLELTRDAAPKAPIDNTGGAMPLSLRDLNEDSRHPDLLHTREGRTMVIFRDVRRERQQPFRNPYRASQTAFVSLLFGSNPRRLPEKVMRRNLGVAGELWSEIQEG